MALRTREQYISALKKMRPNVHKFGELIEDVTTHPATMRVVESHLEGSTRLTTRNCPKSSRPNQT